MEKKERIIQTIYCAIDDVNQLLPKELQIEKSPDTIIIGRGGKLDSLGIVNLIVAIEAKTVEEFGITINLTDEKAMSENNSPLETISTLADYLNTLIEEQIDA